MANSHSLGLASTITRSAISPDQNYFIGRIRALETLLTAMNEEAAAYQQLNPSKNQKDPKLIEQTHSLIDEWHERVKHDLDALKADIKAYLNNRVKRALISAEVDDASRARFTKQIDKLIQLCGDDLEKSTATNTIVPLDTTKLTSSRLAISRLTTPQIKKGADDLLKEFSTLRENRLTALRALEALRQAQKPDFESEKKFKDYTYADAKSGGANLSGELGGWYISDVTPTQRSLIKKEDAIEKVIGEYLAGTILDAIYNSLQVPNGRYAIVSLIRPIGADEKDKSGKDVYLKSDGIPNYKEDLWAEAWQVAPRPATRPSGLFHAKSLEWTDAFIVNKSLNLLDEFADLAAPRLLLGDFGLHNGNFGVADNAVPGMVHLAALDYGAAFYNFSEPLKPYKAFNGFLPGKVDFYKNHFRDYGKEVNASEAMAKVFIKLGSMPSDVIESALKKGLDKVCEHYNKDALQAFWTRLGMGTIPDYATIDLTKQMMTTFIMNKIKERQQSLKNHGYALLLEHCVVKNGENHVQINIGKLRAYLEKYPLPLEEDKRKVFINFFNGYSLVYHNAPSGWLAFLYAHGPRFITDYIRRNEDNELKYALMAGIIDAQDPKSSHRDYLTYRKNRSFMSRHIKTILIIAGLWAFSGALVGVVASTATAGLAAPVLMILGAVVGAIVGFGVGVVACLIKQGDSKPQPERENSQSGEFSLPPPSFAVPAIGADALLVSRRKIDSLAGSERIRQFRPAPDNRPKQIVLNDEDLTTAPILDFGQSPATPTL